jgi:hypothetical protein
MDFEFLNFLFKQIIIKMLVTFIKHFSWLTLLHYEFRDATHHIKEITKTTLNIVEKRFLLETITGSNKVPCSALKHVTFLMRLWVL